MLNFYTSVVRTIVPIIVGSILAFFASKNYQFDDSFTTALDTALQGVFIGLYYIVVRFFEAKFPKAGLLLGSLKKPQYTENQ